MKKDQQTLLVAASEIICHTPLSDMKGVADQAGRMVDLVRGLHLGDEEKEEIILRVSCALLAARRFPPQEAIEAALHLYDLVEKEPEDSPALG